MRDEDLRRLELEITAFLQEEARRMKITSWLMIAIGLIFVIGWLATKGPTGSNA